MKALILCGGFGTRLKEVVADRPKVMALVGGKPFLFHLLENLRQNGILDVVLSIGYLGDFIRDYFKDGDDLGLKIEYSEERFPMGTGGAVKNAHDFFVEPYFVFNGDTYLKADYKKLYEFHLKSKSLVTIAVVARQDISQSGFVVLEKNDRIGSFEEKSKTRKSGYVNAGVYVISPGVFDNIPQKRFSIEKDLFPKLVKSKRVYAFKVSGDFVDIGNRKNYELAKRLFLKKKGKIIESQVPARVSFAGGGTDLPEFFLKNGGAVLGAAINKYAHVKLRVWDRPEIRVNLLDFKAEKSFPVNKYLPYDNSVFDLICGVLNKFRLKLGCEITIWSDFPPGLGLGSSSAVCEALILAFSHLKKQKINPLILAKLAVDIERDELNIPGGWQDQYQSAFGGINYIDFGKNGLVNVRNISIAIAGKLEENLLLVFLGGRRSEKNQQSKLVQSILFSTKTRESLESLKNVVFEMKNHLVKGEFNKFGKLLSVAWQFKKQSSDIVSNKFIDKIYDELLSGGALGGKLVGAGGGGYLLMYCPKKSQKKLQSLLAKLNLEWEKVSFSKGYEVKVYED